MVNRFAPSSPSNRSGSTAAYGFHDLSPRTLRDQVIPLPHHAQGYSRVMLVGTTGAGKTTLLRNLIGSDHRRDRFPSTSAAKTTIAEIEVITAFGPFEAVVTFSSYDEVMADVEDCLDAACLAALHNEPDDQVATALLEHPEQRFRLSYVLGSWQPEANQSEDDAADDLGYDDYAESPYQDDANLNLDAEEVVERDERQVHRARLSRFVAVLRRLSTHTKQRVSAAHGPLEEQSTARARTEWTDELYLPALHQHDDYRNLVGDIMDEIETRFNLVTHGTFDVGGDLPDWPARWRYQTSDRAAFLRQVRWFSSNHHEQFGRLLTPLVNGVRVQGPFYPSHGVLDHRDLQLVLLDGEGLGHSSKEVGSISTKITERFRDVDLILLVDSAAQPMQAAPMQLLTAVGTHGHSDKLAVVFTHFDQVKGDNLRSLTQKREHVRASIGNAISSLRDDLEPRVVETLSARLNEHVFFLGALDRAASRIPQRDVDEMQDLIRLMDTSGQLPEPTDLLPIYDFDRFDFALNDATDDFKLEWAARLGLQDSHEIEREHWARIKALCRRLGLFGTNEYKKLKPAADLIRHLQGMISDWLGNPVDWTRSHDEAEEEVVLDSIRRSVSQRIHELAEKSLIDDHVRDWIVAYNYSGRGSTRVRARFMMNEIYEPAAPKIRSRSDERMEQFRVDVASAVRDAIEDAGSESGRRSPQLESAQIPRRRQLGRG